MDFSALTFFSWVIDHRYLLKSNSILKTKEEEKGRRDKIGTHSLTHLKHFFLLKNWNWELQLLLHFTSLHFTYQHWVLVCLLVIVFSPPPSFSSSIVHFFFFFFFFFSLYFLSVSNLVVVCRGISSSLLFLAFPSPHFLLSTLSSWLVCLSTD